MNRLFAGFFLGLSCTLAAMQPMINAQQPPTSSLFNRFCHSVASKVGSYLPSAQTMRAGLRPFVPSSSTVFLGLGTALVQAGWSALCDKMTSDDSNSGFSRAFDYVSYANNCILHAVTGWEGGRYILDKKTNRRCYYSSEPLRYALLEKQLQFQKFSNKCKEHINNLELQNKNNKDCAHFKDALLNTVARRKLARLDQIFNRFGGLCERCESKNNDDNFQEIYDLLNNQFNDCTLSEIEQYVTHCGEFNNKNDGDPRKKINNQIDEKLLELDTVISASEKFINSAERKINKINKLEPNTNPNNVHSPAVNPPGHGELKNGFSLVYAGMEAAKSIGSSILFSKAVAFAGSANSLHKAASLLALASAKPGFCGLATLFGVNCATIFGTMAAAYALEKVVIKPLLKPLFVRLSCKLRGIPYNPQPAH